VEGNGGEEERVVPRVLISVYDKRGIAEFAEGLARRGWEIVSTGGTARILGERGLAVLPIERVTGFPEMLDGRVKTLHPAVHAGLLARRDVPAHMDAIRAHGIVPIDLVVVNLYPFRETIAKAGVTFGEAIEQIDIGGPSMLRSAAKNHAAVLAIVDPADYDRVLAALDAGPVPETLRRELAAKVFAHTGAYDTAIAAYLAADEAGGLPTQLPLALSRHLALRYGENPDQRAALYVTDEPGMRDLRQLHGKELSFNNILDIEGALLAVEPWAGRPACAVIKHTTPCGIALGPTAAEAYRRALATDPTSAFGSVIAFTTAVDRATADAMHDLFVEVVVAPEVEPDALAVFQRKKNLRVVVFPAGATAAPALDFKRVRGGLLAQDRFRYSTDESAWKVATGRTPTADEWRDLRFAWSAVAAVKSNAILLARGEASIGIGAGQMSRVDASFLAVHKARAAGHTTEGAVLASDAFFPFPDGVEEAAAAGVRAIIQPGGSVRDQDVIATADAKGIAMVLTGRRQFRH
jgi:phosphoribosylaminoimidazolecarboxamide formyltransferase/IMP cyclohydrolase